MRVGWMPRDRHATAPRRIEIPPRAWRSHPAYRHSTTRSVRRFVPEPVRVTHRAGDVQSGDANCLRCGAVRDRAAPVLRREEGRGAPVKKETEIPAAEFR